MSYCVNCGVELAKSEKSCPLCNTEVLNPNQPWKEPRSRPYPREVDIIVRNVDRRYIASIIGVFLCIPVLVTLICDLIYGGAITWSAYVIGSGIVLFVWVVLPLYFKRYRLIPFLVLDCAALIFFLMFINLLNGKGTWFLPLGLPIAGGFSVLLVLSAFLFQRGSGRLFLVRAAIVLIDISVLTLLIEMVTDLYSSGEVMLGWSPFVVLPCLVLAIATQILERRKNWKEEVKKRMFY